MRCRAWAARSALAPARADPPMPRFARTALLTAIAAVPVATAGAQQQQPPPPDPPAVVDANPCSLAKRWHIRCPDLRMKRPFGLYLQRSRGQSLLRAGNSIDNIGGGPAELRGVRVSRRFMRATQ